MATPNTTSADFVVGTEGNKRCAACQHSWAEHDGISARFCAATIVSGSDRGCVCAPTANTVDSAVATQDGGTVSD
ncbi:RGCVC family protein [Actinophytocola xanthii]|uniref:Uncharacterized protein n=1 Tax=Actinophytocola xanthii TaxID=1912961 RepID=A0A1Q8CUI4_9PSEU|nr:RGCVC family protein [Actinophytocola xanthii]OLF18025.1 hypothetical protein BU204_07695 [Actinophytocola xanthii]